MHASPSVIVLGALGTVGTCSPPIWSGREIVLDHQGALSSYEQRAIQGTSA